MSENPSVLSCLFVHAGSDFDVLDARFLGQGEGRGGMQLRPLGEGFYGYLARDEQEAAQALRFARSYLQHAPTKDRAIHAFSVHLNPGDVQFGSVWNDALLTSSDRQARDEWAAANAIAPGPERRAAYDALNAKYPRRVEPTPKAFRTEVLNGIGSIDGLIEVAAHDLSRLHRAGKWPPDTPDDAIVADMRAVLEQHEAKTNFDAWFGASKVVDEAGKPLVVYHGTNHDEPISTFCGHSYAGWFTSDPKKAAAYTSSLNGEGSGNAAIYPSYVAISNPLNLSRINANDEFDANVLARAMGVDTNELQDLFDEVATGPAFWNLIDTPSFREWVEALGKDGVKIMEDDFLTWAAVRPEQIKSAIDNNHLFPRANPDIADRRVLAAQEARNYLADMPTCRIDLHA